jgi:hypothetical protein
VKQDSGTVATRLPARSLYLMMPQEILAPPPPKGAG